jgi:hypothetical protein
VDRIDEAGIRTSGGTSQEGLSFMKLVITNN